MTWGLIMMRRLPDGRRRMEPVRDSSTGEPVAFPTHAEAQAAAARLASVPDAEFRAAPLRAPKGDRMASEDKE